MIRVPQFSLALISGIFLLFATPAFCAGLTSADESNITKLENKFFQHTYPKEPADVRLGRLEKMIFGDARDGTDSNERLGALLKSVPNLDEPQAPAAPADNEQASSNPAAETETARGGKHSKARSAHPVAEQQEEAGEPADTSQYPAVTAMEKKLLGKEFAKEPVQQRLARLETKVFGKPSNSEDLGDRVDRLKQQTGIDISRLAPNGSDWQDEEDDTSPVVQQRPLATTGDGDGEDGKSFSGRDIRKDMQRAFGMPSASGGYGMGSAGSRGGAASGAYGFGGSRTRSAPPADAAPLDSMSAKGEYSQSGGMGMGQQVSALENEVLGRAHSGEPLGARLNRLEAQVFPNQKPAVEMPLPDRVHRLLTQIPISQPAAPKTARRNSQADPYGDLDDDPDLASLQQQQQQLQKNKGGLKNLFNRLGNMMGGGNYYGSYAMPSASYLKDPATGMLIDQSTGNFIDPATGLVVRRSSSGYSTGLGTGMGIGVGGMNSFNNGFAPYGSPMMPYGTMPGGGVNFGMGGMGRGFGGMWP